MDDSKRTEIEAAVFRHLVAHLDENKDVQNIDLMNLALRLLRVLLCVVTFQFLTYAL